MFKSIMDFLFGKAEPKPPPPPVSRSFVITEPFEIVCGSPKFVQDAYNSFPYNEGNAVDGFYDRQSRTIYVIYGTIHEDLPHPLHLGHELMHLPEIGGAYHK